MRKTMRRSKYCKLIDRYAKEFGLSESLKFDLKRLNSASMKILVTKDYHVEFDNILGKMGIEFSHLPIDSGDFALRLITKIV